MNPSKIQANQKYDPIFQFDYQFHLDPLDVVDVHPWLPEAEKKKHKYQEIYEKKTLSGSGKGQILRA